MVSNSEVSFCVDTLLVETVLADPKFYKKAGFVSDLLAKVKDYFSHQIDPKNPAKSVIDILAPGALWLLFQSLGIGKWGFLLGLLMDVFHVDVSGMLQSLWNKVREMVGSGKKISSAEVDAATQATTQEFSTPGTPEEAQQAYQKIQQQQNVPAEPTAQADDGMVYSSLELLHDAKMISLALIEYETQKLRLTKEAVNMNKFLGGYSGTKAKGTSLLGKIFGWIIKLALASAGLMVAGDIANEMLGRPSALSGTYQKGQEGSEVPVPQSGPKATQTKFPFKADSTMPSSWPLVNNDVNIENMLVQFAKDTYSGLDGKEDVIRSSPAFQAIKQDISWFNVHNPNSAAIFIPKNYTTRRGIVDYFIDDVAQRAK
jgi:hypothetical protein